MQPDNTELFGVGVKTNMGGGNDETKGEIWGQWREVCVTEKVRTMSPLKPHLFPHPILTFLLSLMTAY